MIKDDLLSGKQTNSLSLIKTIAALQVVYSHLLWHLELPDIKWISIITTYYNGVPIFFIISGFLIWFSIERSVSYKSYLTKRFWRIYPELWIAVAIEIASILIFYRDWNVKHLVLFTLTQGTVLQFWTPGSLRGYGCGTPNGTLWTMCATIQFYVVAWFIHKMIHKKQWIKWIIGFIVLVGASLSGELVFERIGVETLIKLYDQSIIRYCWLFYIGCFIAEFKDSLFPVLTKFWYFFLGIGVIPYWTGFDIYAGYQVMWSVLLAFGLIGYAYRFPELAVCPDISYGVFLYHMIFVNIFISVGWIGNWWFALGALVITMGGAYLSTITVGNWSAKRKALIKDNLDKL